MTYTEKAIAGTWYTITCTAAATVTQEIEGEIAELATLKKSGTTSFRASASTVTIQTEGRYHILPTKASAAVCGGGEPDTHWESSTELNVITLPYCQNKKFIQGGYASIAGNLIPGGKLTHLTCGIERGREGNGKLRLRQRVPGTGELVLVGYGNYTGQTAEVGGNIMPHYKMEDCTLVAGRDLVIDFTEQTDCFIYATGPVDGCSITENNGGMTEIGWLVLCKLRIEQTRQWQVTTTGAYLYAGWPTRIWTSPLDSLIFGYRTFFRAMVTVFEPQGGLPNLTDGEEMFLESNVRHFKIDLPNLVNGYRMFESTPLEIFDCNDLSHLSDAERMFCDTNLPASEIERIINLLPDFLHDQSLWPLPINPDTGLPVELIVGSDEYNEMQKRMAAEEHTIGFGDCAGANNVPEAVWQLAKDKGWTIDKLTADL